MCVCRLMLEDFQHGHKDIDKEWIYPIGYTDYDLQCGLDWARGWLSEGLQHDSLSGIHFRSFIKWAKHKLKYKI